VRREEGRIRRYVHMGTGNYNPGTARVYTDLGLFSADPVLADDISDLFNYLTGYSRQQSYQKLLVAPAALREEILKRIEREIARHKESGGGHLIFKMNALVDKASIRALYQASQAGVRIDLVVRGICGLKPGVPRVSETITVRSIVGRFLEHARLYYFRNGGDEEVLAGSADLMPRNLDGRVEALFPIEDERLKRAIHTDILLPQLRDNVRARELDAEGRYTRLVPPKNEPAVDCQAYLLEAGGSWRLED
jgi:polyphosphate kinase